MRLAADAMGKTGTGPFSLGTAWSFRNGWVAVDNTT